MYLGRAAGSHDSNLEEFAHVRLVCIKVRIDHRLVLTWIQ
jgi:hypothetical protein